MSSNAMDQYPGDVYMYYGQIDRRGYDSVSDVLENRKTKADKACLILITFGGDPNSAYRIARALHHHYRNVEILIPDACKSAGTLMCIGANKLIFGDRGELGPLDIQLSKPDEMFEHMSGLDIIQAVNVLQNQVLSSFRDYLVDIRGGSQIRTKTAAEIATKLASGFVSPIAQKIDPVTLGEHQRAMQIAFEYGNRLNEMAKSLRPQALQKLIGSYPVHGFVIDRKEATQLFNCVIEPDTETEGLYSWARELIKTVPMPSDVPLVSDLKGENDEDANEPDPSEETHPDTESGGNEGDHEGAGAESTGNESPVDGADEEEHAA